VKGWRWEHDGDDGNEVMYDADAGDKAELKVRLAMEHGGET